MLLIREELFDRSIIFRNFYEMMMRRSWDKESYMLDNKFAKISDFRISDRIRNFYNILSYRYIIHKPHLRDWHDIMKRYRKMFFYKEIGYYDAAMNARQYDDSILFSLFAPLYTPQQEIFIKYVIGRKQSTCAAALDVSVLVVVIITIYDVYFK